MLNRPQQRMHDPRLGPYRKHPATSRQRNAHLGRTPHRPQIGTGDHTDHHVSPTQPLIQPPLPLLTNRDPITQIPIPKHLMAPINQPLMQLTGTPTILTGMADKHPSHCRAPLQPT
jgi:hypothetical protein